MFVKIRHSNVKKDENRVVIKNKMVASHFYECNHYSLFSTPVRENENVVEMNITIEFNESGPQGFDRTISFPCESDTQVTEIYVMNEHGKTIDRIYY